MNFWPYCNNFSLLQIEAECSSKYVRLCTEVPSSSSMDLDLNRNQVLKGQFEVERPPNKRVGTLVSSITSAQDISKTSEVAVSSGGHNGLYRCESCGCKFQLDYQLWWHWRDHIPIRDRILCHLCPYVSTNSESLKQVKLGTYIQREMFGISKKPQMNQMKMNINIC